VGNVAIYVIVKSTFVSVFTIKWRLNSEDIEQMYAKHLRV